MISSKVRDSRHLMFIDNKSHARRENHVPRIYFSALPRKVSIPQGEFSGLRILSKPCYLSPSSPKKASEVEACAALGGRTDVALTIPTVPPLSPHWARVLDEHL